MIVCGVPNIVCALILLFCMPESPKFKFANGDEIATLKILETVYSVNMGKPKETFRVKTLIKDGEYLQNHGRRSKNLLQFMWSQTAPLFQHPHLKNTLTICFIQFCIFNTSNGFWSFFPEITNRIAIWTESDPSHVSATLCEILDDTRIVKSLNETIVAPLCVTKLEVSTFANVYILNVIYAIGWTFLAMIINYVGKLAIISTLLFSCAATGVALIFVSHPTVSNYLYIILLCDGLALTVLNVSTVELFPTKFRCVSSTQVTRIYF